jgi:hypothetical protein
MGSLTSSAARRLRASYALERRAARRADPRRRLLALRAGFSAPFRAPRLLRLRFVAPLLATFATARDGDEPPLLLLRRAFFHSRRAVAASLRARRASRRASLKRLRARFNWSLASLICCRATSARSLAVAKDSAGAASPCSLTSAALCGVLKSLPEFCDGVTAVRFPDGPGTRVVIHRTCA